MPKTEPAVYAKTLQGLPWETVSPAVRELRMRNEVVSPAFLTGMADSHIGPALAKQHALLLQDAQYVTHMRGFMETMVPCRAVVLPVLETYATAHQVQEPDIWAVREVVLTDGQHLTPVPVAIWDSGIDLQLFPGRLFTNPSPSPDEDPHGIAFDVHDERTHGSLIPLSADQKRQYPDMVKLMEGLVICTTVWTARRPLR